MNEEKTTREEVTIDAGSFRDPSGSVFYYAGRVFRALGKESAKILRQLQENTAVKGFIQQGSLIPYPWISSDNPIYQRLKPAFPEAEGFVEHPRLPLITYPYEWTYSMIADAAQLHLKLQLLLLSQGYSLKDASAYNIQFHDGRPIFIDLASIEIPAQRDIWVAYGQFCRHFLFPLLLKRHKNFGLKGYYLTHMEGLDVEDVFKIFGRWGALKPPFLIDVWLQRFFGSIANRNIEGLKKEVLSRQTDAKPQIVNLERLIRKVGRLSRWNQKTSQWLNYQETNTYTDQTEQQKIQCVQGIFQKNSIKTVLDLGCNTGQYSLLAAKEGIRVTAVDSDHDCVDSLYQRLRESNLKITPLWVDLANPSPALGFMHQERRSFLERVPSECVLALALIHHLLITSRIPLGAICDLLSRLTTSLLLVEYIAPQDSMFRRLLALRQDLYEHVSEEFFTATFAKKFELLHRQPLQGTHRTLYLFKKKTG
ncbi:MAG: class I SAM-dependent methyltransferase [Candidatus Omnitrophica bacterium]|nr:class I SAM-dependent methyltransferase [Candidatus Omnitrophota bacterium]